MDYRTIYQFDIQSDVAEADIRITIEKDGYGGSVKQRALGGAPILRREQSGHIHGTSCTLVMEASEEGDYEDLYTSDPREFRVRVFRNSAMIFVGFVTPELLSVPDLSAPYDVEMTAVDGLGELKFTNYGDVISGDHTIEEIFSAICGASGNTNDVAFYTGLVGKTGRTSYTSFPLLSINLDYLAEESCYDVLEKLLTAMNCEITHSASDDAFFVISKADLHTYTSQLYEIEFGSMQSKQCWPVGHLSSSVVPAKNSVRVTGETKLKLVNFPTTEILEDIDEECVEKGSNGRYEVTGETTSAHAIITEEYLAAPGRDAYMVFRASRTGGPAYVYVMASCIPPGGGLKVYNPSTREWLLASSPGDLINSAFRLDIPYGTTGELKYLIPWTQVVSENCSSFRVEVVSTSTDGYDIERFCLYSTAPMGYETTVNVDNGAREAQAEKDSIIVEADDTVALPADQHQWQYGVPHYDGSAVSTFRIGRSNNYSGPFMYVMAMDYARMFAAPRHRVTGTLNTPLGLYGIPMLMTRDGVRHFVDTAEWDLLADEVTVSLDEEPTASLAATGSITKKYGSQAVPDEL